MNEATAIALNALNRDFYRESAADFARTRSAPWPGWRELPPLLEDRPGASILDAGCGNGRFASFLRDALGTPFLYCGIDSSAPLLALARRALARVPGARLLQADLVLEPPERALPDERFDLVAAFGLLHHVPGESRRRELIRALAARVAKGGFLALTFWDFAGEPRFARKALAQVPAELSGQLEPGDVLLRWGNPRTPSGSATATTPTLRKRRACSRSFHSRRGSRSRATAATGRLNRYRVLEQL